MIDEHIVPGDIVIVHQQQTADNGDIVVALLGDEATVKKLHQAENGMFLMPANPAYHPIPVTNEVSIIGKVVGLIREHPVLRVEHMNSPHELPFCISTF